MKHIEDRIASLHKEVAVIAQEFNIPKLKVIKLLIKDVKLDWTIERKAEFTADYPSMPIGELAKKYNVTEKAVNQLATKLKLKKDNYFWLPDDEKKLVEKYATDGVGMTELLQMFPGRTEYAIINKYRQLTGKR